MISDIPHLREKTAKIGLIGRAAAVFRVDEIIVFQDNHKGNRKGSLDLFASLLAYMETPQYLRRRLIELKPQFRYAGILPPLRTPHHPLNKEHRKLRVGEYREGVTTSKSRKGSLVDIGVERPALLPRKQLPNGKRLTVKITKTRGSLEVQLIDRESIPEYWGYKVAIEEGSLGTIDRRKFDLTIATSKYGVSIVDTVDELAKKWKRARRILIEFGGTNRGLYEMARAEGVELNEVVDLAINMIPHQGTKTVRIEEAIIASLAVLRSNILF